MVARGVVHGHGDAGVIGQPPNAGSDAAAIRTRARYDDATKEWVLNGTKTWATNGGIANIHVVNALTDPALGARGHALFLIPPGTRGLSQGQKFSKHGLRASHTAEVILDEVRIPADLVLGGKDALDQRLAAAREGSRVRVPAAMATFELTFTIYEGTGEIQRLAISRALSGRRIR
ncbi:alkylation response protein AidB-like acyl-CoA dehydrogenase [Streptomyces sp. 3330]|nr:alkylation response protein AidB-like acyl-CoA dehydrogenase [Streptomyces sp. 3330]